MENVIMINISFDKIKELFVELEDNLSILLVGKLISVEDIQDIQKIIIDIENEINNGKENLGCINFDKKKEIKKVYDDYQEKIINIKKIFSENFLY